MSVVTGCTTDQRRAKLRCRKQPGPCLEDVLHDECAVDLMTPFGIQECYGDVSNALAEVVVAANGAEVAGRFTMTLRRKELRRLRAALWNLRLKLEDHTAVSGCCTLTVRHRLEALRSASLDICHPEMRALDAPNATAIPNFQAVHQEFKVDANIGAGGSGSWSEQLWVSYSSGDGSGDSSGDDGTCEVDATRELPAQPDEIAFYRGGQPTAEGRAWMVARSFKTVIDLRKEDRDNQWIQPSGGFGGIGKLGDTALDVVHMPVTDMLPPTFEAGTGTGPPFTTLVVPPRLSAAAQLEHLLEEG